MLQVNTDLSFGPSFNVKMIVGQESITDAETDNESEAESIVDLFDPEYNESESSSDTMEEESDHSIDQTTNMIENETLFMIYWSCLLPLLRFCLNCRAAASIKKTFVKGTLLVVNLFCINHHETVWYSQPVINGTALGNVAISAGILFSGNTFQRIKELMDIVKVTFISHTTFNNIQNNYLFPAIHSVYLTNRTILFENAKEKEEVHLLGDGRCDSPGYGAKYGTDTLMDSVSSYIFDFEVPHSKMAGNSQRMELDGLKEVLATLRDLE